MVLFFLYLKYVICYCSKFNWYDIRVLSGGAIRHQYNKWFRDTNLSDMKKANLCSWIIDADSWCCGGCISFECYPCCSRVGSYFFLERHQVCLCLVNHVWYFYWKQYSGSLNLCAIFLQQLFWTIWYRLVYNISPEWRENCKRASGYGRELRGSIYGACSKEMHPQVLWGSCFTRAGQEACKSSHASSDQKYLHAFHQLKSGLYLPCFDPN